MRAWKPFPPKKKETEKEEMFLRKLSCNLLLKNWNQQFRLDDPGLDIGKFQILPKILYRVKHPNAPNQMAKYGSGDVLLFWSELKLITCYMCFLYTLVCLSYSTFKLKNSRPHLYCSMISSCWVYYQFCGRYAKNDFQSQPKYSSIHRSILITFSQVRKNDKVNKKCA